MVASAASTATSGNQAVTVAESPEEIALAYMNNLAFAHGMRPVYQFGYYVGTFGEYDMAAVRRRG